MVHHFSSARFRQLAPVLLALCGLLLSAETPLAHARHPDAARIEAQAVALAGQGQRAEADKLFRRALQLDLASLGSEHPGVAVDYSDYAANLLAEGKIVKAEQLATKAVAIVRAQRAAVLQMGDAPDAALSRARAHLNHADPLGFVFERYLDASWALAGAGHSGDEHLRSKAFMAAQDLAGSATAHAMAQAAAKSATKDGPLGAILREQQRLTAEVLQLDRRLMATSAGGAKAAAIPDAVLRRRLHADMVRLAETNRQIDRQFPEYRALISPLPLSIAHARGLLSPNEGLLLLHASKGDVHSFAIGPQGSAWSRVPAGAAAMAGQLARLQCQVDLETCGSGHTPAAPATGHAAYDLAAAHALYASLVEPVERPLQHARKIYVVTSGFLGDLPLAMLVTAPPVPRTDAADPRVLAAAPWLGDRYAFIHLPAVAGLRLKLARVPVSRLDLLDAYGDPLLGSVTAPQLRGAKLFRGDNLGAPGLADPDLLRSLPSLPGTRRELTALAAAAGAQSSLHLQERATEREVKNDPRLATSGLVVFATHGLLAGEIGEGAEAGLILTPPEIASAEDDGILTASEASQLTLSADWVILSACNTAAAAGAAGHDSMDSLGRAFLYAGAHALLASHWRVSDDATAALTVEALATHKTHPDLTGAQALQAAMRAVRTGLRRDGSALPDWHESWAHPSAWAPFSYISDHDD
jgi:CHAT domain-containing protein